MAQNHALVAVENVTYHFDILYSYEIPFELIGKCVPGSWVRIPFGRGTSQCRGVVFALSDEELPPKCKKILQLLDGVPLLSEEGLELAEFLKERTFCTYYDASRVQLPAGFYYDLRLTYCISEEAGSLPLTDEEKKVADFLRSTGAYFSEKDIFEALGIEKGSDVLQKLVSKGAVKKNYDAEKRVGDLTVRQACLKLTREEIESSFPALTGKQQAVLDVLYELGECSVKELCYYSGVSASVITGLEKKGIIFFENEDVYRIPKQYLSTGEKREELVLNDEQKAAFESLFELFRSGGGVALLYGVTGSGKTAVFLKLIDSVLSEGRDVIVMVPEIALTPQMMAIFRSSFGERVAIFHSALSVGERRDEFRRVLDGRAQIVVGTRSAVFAPFRSLGLIVIDEEQEHTYRSEASPKFDAREVARFRASRSDALVLLSSATPSVESFSRAEKGSYKLFKLSKRFGGAVLPEVEIVDMKAEQRRGNYTSFSVSLQTKLREALENKKQAVLLLNRRGYNTFAACNACGRVMTCPNCSVSLTYHSKNGKLMCHYCGHSENFRSVCPYCGEREVRYAGTGTQKIEQELEAMFPEARVLRLDTDSVISRRSFETGLSDFGEGKYDILLGTQMVAKGLDFSAVTLVGVINADTQLYDDDYRSQENTFDLLTQVVGRSGRGSEKGCAVIQTINPENSVIRMAKEQNYEAFFGGEIEIRKRMIYPPFCDLCVVTTSAEQNSDAYVAVRMVLKRIRELCAGEFSDVKLLILPPTVPRVERVNNRSRHKMVIKCKNNRRFREMISIVLKEMSSSGAYRKVSFSIDINP